MTFQRFRTMFYMPFSKRQQALLESRPRMEAAVFVSQIGAAGGDIEAATMIYAHLLAWNFVDGFTPYPDDALDHVYGIVEEELEEDIILHILETLGVAVPSQMMLSNFGPANTPVRIAQLIQQARAPTGPPG